MQLGLLKREQLKSFFFRYICYPPVKGKPFVSYARTCLYLCSDRSCRYRNTLYFYKSSPNKQGKFLQSFFQVHNNVAMASFDLTNIATLNRTQTYSTMFFTNLKTFIEKFMQYISTKVVYFSKFFSSTQQRGHGKFRSHEHRHPKPHSNLLDHVFHKFKNIH